MQNRNNSPMVISGIPFDDPGGSGRFLRVLISESERHNFDWRFTFLRNPLISAAPVAPSSTGFTPKFKRFAKWFVLRVAPFRIQHVLKRLWNEMQDTKVRKTRQGLGEEAHSVIENDVEKAFSASNLVVFHPQGIGYDALLHILKKRQFSWVFTLDASFFCRKSYNHHNVENAACLRCVGGHFDRATEMGCQNFPFEQSESADFQADLFELTRSGRVGFFAQNPSQESLLKAHFGEETPVVLCGMSADFEMSVDRGEILQDDRIAEQTIVFHANPLLAKGVGFTLELASLLPDFNFIFPFHKIEVPESHVALLGTLQNCEFVPTTWEEGLLELVRRSAFVICPSLWSAPVEGAVVKSIIYGNKVLVVDEQTAFQYDLRHMPSNKIISLPPTPAAAAEMVRQKSGSPFRIELDKEVVKSLKGDSEYIVAKMQSQFDGGGVQSCNA